jgi:hypothetical protein
MKLSNLNLEPALQQFLARLLNRGIGPDNLRESYAFKANLPNDIKFRQNGTDLEVSLDEGKSWRKVTLT